MSKILKCKAVGKNNKPHLWIIESRVAVSRGNYWVPVVYLGDSSNISAQVFFSREDARRAARKNSRADSFCRAAKYEQSFS